MLVETVIQLVAPTSLELAFREMAVPPAKTLVRQGAAPQTTESETAAERDHVALAPMLAPGPGRAGGVGHPRAGARGTWPV